MRGIRSTSKLLGERGITLTKSHKIPKLSLEFIGYVVISAAISLFSFTFLYSMSESLSIKFAEASQNMQGVILDGDLVYYIQLACGLGAMIVFVSILLFLIGKKVSYILTINNAVQSLEGGNLAAQIEIEGDDELSELAFSINNFSAAITSHMEQEEILKSEKSSLVKSLSHDIRTPLTSIISYSDFIKNKKYNNEEQLKEYLSVIENKAYRIKELTDQLFMSDIQNNHPFESEDFVPIVDGKLLILQLLQEILLPLSNEGFDIEVNGGNTMDTIIIPDFEINIDPPDLARIFENLASNISKYAEKAKPVVLAITMADNQLKIKQANHIFTCTQSSNESHGIGLKNIDKLAVKYGGYMYAHTENNLYEVVVFLGIHKKSL